MCLPNECVLDPDGHYVILKEILNHVKIIWIGVYAPHGNQLPFGTKICSYARGQTDSEMLLFGDFNTIMDIRLDR